jgi:hypothetical protein
MIFHTLYSDKNKSITESPEIIPTIIITVSAFWFFLLVIIAFAGLIPLGYWADEFATLANIRDGGWNFFFDRLTTWSPRPISELMIFAYGRVVERLQKPLIAQSLGAMWLMLAFSMVAIPIVARRSFPSATSFCQCLLLSLGLYCLMLVGHPVAEMFYWPIGSFPYMSAISGAAGALWIFAVTGVESRTTRAACAAMLIFTALSAEVGAIFVAVFCLLAGFSAGWDWLRRSPQDAETRSLLWLALPFAASVGVLIALATNNRTGASSEMFGDAAVAHHILKVLQPSLSTFLAEAISIDGATLKWQNILWGAVTKGLFFIAALGVLRPILSHRPLRGDSRLFGLFGAACIASTLVIIAATYYQCGQSCFERLVTFRQCLFFIGLTGIAGFFAGVNAPAATAPSRTYAPSLYVLCLILSVLIPTWRTVPKLGQDYASYAASLKAQKASWKAGLAAGDDAIYRQRRPGKIVGGVWIGDGVYSLNDDSKWAVIHWIIGYFHKKSITFVTDQ